MMSPPQVVALVSGADYLKIEVRRRLYPNHRDPDTRQWLDAAVSASVGSFQCHVSSNLHIGEMEGFKLGLTRLVRTRKGQAFYSAMESWLDLTLEIGESGLPTATGTVQDRPGIGNTLTFILSLTWEEVERALASLNGALESLRTEG